VVFAASLCFLLVVSQSASAQRGGRFARLFGAVPSVTLAQLEEVAKDLKLNDEQKKKAADLQEEMSAERRELFQDAAGDFDRLRQDIAELYKEVTTKFNALLDEPQQKRAHEIYVQVNGPVTLSDELVAKTLQLTDEQKQKVEQARTDSRTQAFSAFQDFQNMTDEEREKKTDELIQNRDKSLLAVLNDQQRGEFDKLKGQALEVDLPKLPVPGR
jgi:hypothetical protein